MGVWGTGISSNDTYADVYGEFFELYDDGLSVADISAKLVTKYSESIDDPDDSNNFWFALAKARWECRELDEELLDKVEKIVESGEDLLAWRRLDASERDLRKRDFALKAFLEKLHSEKAQNRKRKKRPIRTPIFEKGNCLTFNLSNGNYGGAVVLDGMSGKGYSYNLVAATRINQREPPSTRDFRRAEVLVLNFAKWDDNENIIWLLEKTFKRDEQHFKLIANIEVASAFDAKKYSFAYGGDWKGSLIEAVELQLEYEKLESRPKKRIKISSICKRSWIPWV